MVVAAAFVEVGLTVMMIVAVAMAADTAAVEVAMMILIAALATMIDAGMAVVTTMALVESIDMLLEAVKIAMVGGTIVAAATILLTVTADAVEDIVKLPRETLTLQALMIGIRVGKEWDADGAGLLRLHYDLKANGRS